MPVLGVNQAARGVSLDVSFVTVCVRAELVPVVARHIGVVKVTLLGNTCVRVTATAAADREETSGALEQRLEAAVTEERTVRRETRCNDGRARFKLRPQRGHNGDARFLLCRRLEDDLQLLIRVVEAYRGADHAENS